ncbi:hypothetical protein [Sphingomonas quercus]|uniref:Uncharacterized protein n=1 Tax=Sphingomonas quercus TaxID=2842451 RepID=A0ABS6BG91_9SPHN|nr:hypothetical protein [Sphingomonas quercus]MBU3076597.1 hypothetical protein [Sphingomonas quercus]
MLMQSRDFGAMRIVAPPRRSAIVMRRATGAAVRAITAPLAAILFLILATWLVVGTGLGVAAYLGRRARGAAGVR